MLIVLTPIWPLQSPQKLEIWKLTKHSNNFTFVAFSKYILMYIQGFLTNNAATKIRQGREQHSLKWKQNKKTVHPRNLNPAEIWDHIFMVIFPWKSNEGLNSAGPKPGYSHTVSEWLQMKIILQQVYWQGSWVNIIIFNSYRATRLRNERHLFMWAPPNPSTHWDQWSPTNNGG